MKCKSFKEFSTMMSTSPKFAELNLKAMKKRHVLKHLYQLTKQAEQIEQLRIRILQQFKKVGPRLKKYGDVAKAMTNAGNYIAKALRLSSKIKPPYVVTKFVPILEKAIGMVDDALGILETSRRFIVGYEIPLFGKGKQLSARSAEEVKDSLIRLLMDTTRGEERLNPDTGAGISELTRRYAPKHLRTQGANHWLILQAESFLQQKTTAEQKLRLTIIKELFVAAFGERVEFGKIKVVVDRANAKSGKNLSQHPRFKNHA